MAIKTYDPKLVIITMGGVPLGGYADGTFLTVVRDEAKFTKVTGADGETTRAKSNNQSGTATITLLQSSASNDVLSGFAELDDLNNDGVVPFLVKDLSGRTLVAAGEAWIEEEADDEFAKETSDREWTIALGPFQKFTGGN